MTDTLCTCGTLQNSASDPAVPIIFDELTAEYQFRASDGAMMVIYHCPFCGGATPESRRDKLFAVITLDEEQRLTSLLESVRTIEAALAQLGKPERDDASGTTIRTIEEGDRPPALLHFRTLTYERLSTVADVHVTERADGSVYWQLFGKFLGRRKACRARDCPVLRHWRASLRDAASSDLKTAAGDCRRPDNRPP